MKIRGNKDGKKLIISIMEFHQFADETWIKKVQSDSRWKTIRRMAGNRSKNWLVLGRRIFRSFLSLFCIQLNNNSWNIIMAATKHWIWKEVKRRKEQIPSETIHLNWILWLNKKFPAANVFKFLPSSRRSSMETFFHSSACSQHPLHTMHMPGKHVGVGRAMDDTNSSSEFEF